MAEDAKQAHVFPHIAGLLCLVAALLCPTGASIAADGETPSRLHIYLDVDMTVTRPVGESLLQGLTTGLRVGAERYGGPEIRVIVRDHMKNLRRTAGTIDEVLNDAAALAIMGGMQTPHYLKHGTRINDGGIVLLLPWSAGAALTRLARGDDNYIFRLSVDDRRAAPFLSQQAVERGCRSVATLANDDGWGRGNTGAIAGILAQVGVELVYTGFLRGDAGAERTRARLAALERHAPDCMILVLGATASARIVNGLAEWQHTPQVLSHWGMLGGSYLDHVTPRAWSRLDVALLASCGVALPSDAASSTDQQANDTALQILGSGTVQSDIAFVHAYDLALLLHAAIANAREDPRWSGGRVARSAALRHALEGLDTPVSGLLKRYVRPFSPVLGSASYGHEALGPGDLCLARMRPDGSLVPHGPGPRR